MTEDQENLPHDSAQSKTILSDIKGTAVATAMEKGLLVEEKSTQYSLTRLNTYDDFDPAAPSARAQRRKQQRKGKKKYGW